MLIVNIPGYGPLTLKQLVLDYNGTLALDGQLREGVAELLLALSETLQLHVITADTFGSVARELGDLPLELIRPQDTAALMGEEKRALVERLGQQVVAIGNGANDAEMLKSARLGIAVLEAEGLAGPCLQAADLFCPSIHRALELLINPERLKATLRH